MGLFITFEGGEGSGKSFQSKALYRNLDKLAIPALLTHEPGGTILGEKLARLLKYSRDTGILPLTELLMFNTSRSQLVNEIIKPELQTGKVVICDRYTDSTIAYQHFARGLDLKLVKTINNAATDDLKPDLTFLLDVPVGVGLGRKSNKKPDRFETENAAFHQKVRVGYLKMAANE
ncbi:MAG: dTMP kinase, partial [Dehalococcoidales bacterium]|nr:dTMP kinase [Dehalococcoidales bacterium]